MTSTSDLNIAGSPIYESLVGTTGDPYQPPAYQLPEVYGAGSGSAAAFNAAEGGAGLLPGWPAGAVNGGPALAAGTGPAMLSQFLGRMLGDGQSWVAVMVFGGPIADQLRRHQFTQRFEPAAQYGMPTRSGYGSVPGGGFGGGFGYGPEHGAGAGYGPQYGTTAQAYQQAYQWAVQQQSPPAGGQVPSALPALPSGADTAGLAAWADLPPRLPPAQATQTSNGMLGQDWTGWLGQNAQGAQSAQSAQGAQPQREEERQEPPDEPRGARLSSRFGAAMRELRGR